jgi:transcriptional regulator with XRE-family HTH domain
MASELKSLRLEREQTIHEVCKACSMDTRTLRRIEAKKGNPRLLTLLRLYKYYGAKP